MSVSYTRHQRELAAKENKVLVTVALPGFTFQGPVDPEYVKPLDAFVMQWVTRRYKPALDEPLFLLQLLEAGYAGNSPLFWSAGGGYTQWIDDAKRWTAAEADQQIKATKGSHTWAIWPLEDIERMAKRTIDIHDEMAEYRKRKGGAA